MTELLDIPVKTVQGRETALNEFRGKVLLVVNVASKCGLTVQYEGLEKLYADKRDAGLVIAGFPANDFKEQEPGTDAEILEFCTSTYGVDFPMFSKVSVKGPDKHPLYRVLTGSGIERTGDEAMLERFRSRGMETPEGEVLWNFEKFLIGRDGRIAARFAPDVKPDDPRLVSAIEQELSKAA